MLACGVQPDMAAVSRGPKQPRTSPNTARGGQSRSGTLLSRLWMCQAAVATSRRRPVKVGRLASARAAAGIEVC